MTTIAQRSSIFKKYNELKGDGAETGRLNRALGLAQRTEKAAYETTAVSCSCPDFQIRGATCKHMLAKKMQQETASAEKRAASMARVDEINAMLFGD